LGESDANPNRVKKRGERRLKKKQYGGTVGKCPLQSPYFTCYSNLLTQNGPLVYGLSQATGLALDPPKEITYCTHFQCEKTKISLNKMNGIHIKNTYENPFLEYVSKFVFIN